MKIFLWNILALLALAHSSKSQSWNRIESINRVDSVRGGIGSGRDWWNVLQYSITIRPDINTKTLFGSNLIKFEVLDPHNSKTLQIDLQPPLAIDSISINNSRTKDFKFIDGAYFVNCPMPLKLKNEVLVYYSGKPHEALFPPWDGGWIWKNDSIGNPWISVACQGIGASIWFPNKDHQYDEPDEGGLLKIIVPDTLTSISNGRLVSSVKNQDHTTTFEWSVKTPINNYDIIPYIGKYITLREYYMGEKGVLTLDFSVLEYDSSKIKKYLSPQVRLALKSFEKWMGPYPFYNDGFKIVQSPGYSMEHQSAIAYGNDFRFGNRGRDFSQTGWGLTFDFLIVHEIAHEWFGNNITAIDVADKWIHEAFAAYSEVLYLLDYKGETAAEDYVVGMRK